MPPKNNGILFVLTSLISSYELLGTDKSNTRCGSVHLQTIKLIAKPSLVAVPSLIFCFRDNRIFCRCSNIKSTWLPSICFQNIFALSVYVGRMFLVYNHFPFFLLRKNKRTTQDAISSSWVRTTHSDCNTKLQLGWHKSYAGLGCVTNVSFKALLHQFQRPEAY